MKPITYLFCLVSLSTIAANPVIELYVQKVETAKIAVEKQQVEVANEEAKFQVLEQLLGRNAIAKSDFFEQRHHLAIARKTLREKQSKLKEAEFRARGVEQMVSSGKDVPLGGMD